MSDPDYKFIVESSIPSKWSLLKKEFESLYQKARRQYGPITPLILVKASFESLDRSFRIFTNFQKDVKELLRMSEDLKSKRK